MPNNGHAKAHMRVELTLSRGEKDRLKVVPSAGEV